MATPSYKHPDFEAELTRMFGTNRTAIIRANLCVHCGCSADTFADLLSAKEYAISGLCQECQDKVFTEVE